MERALEPKLQTDTMRYLKGFNTIKYLGSAEHIYHLSFQEANTSEFSARTCSHLPARFNRSRCRISLFS
jgi:hypothetical protein